MDITAGDLKSASMSDIQQFFKDKSIFITGATGFVGHVLLSKLLISCPGIDEIYVLLREKKGKTPTDRFNEMLEDEVFAIIKADYPDSLSKIRPIAGDCSKPGLGIAATDRQTLISRVNVIFHVAATVRFDAPIRDAVHMNIRSTSDLLDLAHELKTLNAFVHVSTAFSNCANRTVIEEKLYDAPISPSNLMTLVDNLEEDILERITPGLLGNYPNTYVFTKAVAEEVCRLKGADLPLVIFRPAIVISSQKEPIPGWINNVYGPTGVVAAAAVGLMRVLYADKNSKANVVPCDHVVNAAIASAWSVGTRDRVPEMAVADGQVTKIPNDSLTNGSVPKAVAVNGNISNGYQINGNATPVNDKLADNGVMDQGPVTKAISSAKVCNGSAKVEQSKKLPIYNFSCDLLTKPFTWAEFMSANEVFEPEVPSAMSIWAYSLLLCGYKPMYRFYCALFHILPAFVADNIAKLMGRKPKLMEAYSKVHKLADVLAFFATREWKMTNDNVNMLWSRLSDVDKKIFYFDMNSINWSEYYRIHCFGIRQFILKEHPDTIPAAAIRRRKLLLAHYTLLSVLTFTSVYLVFNVARRILV